MTRAERCAERERKLKAKMEADGKAFAQLQANNRAQDRADRDKRRYKVGAMLDKTGLFVWDDTTIGALCQTLITLRECPDPVAVLKRLLSENRQHAYAVQD